MFWKKNEKRVADDVALEEGEVDISIPNILSNLIESKVKLQNIDVEAPELEELGKFCLEKLSRNTETKVFTWRWW